MTSQIRREMSGISLRDPDRPFFMCCLFPFRFSSFCAKLISVLPVAQSSISSKWLNPDFRH